MTAPTDDLLAAFHQVFGVPTHTMPRDTSPAAFEDEDTLRRSRQSMRAAAQRNGYVRRDDLPREPWMDELAVAAGEWVGGDR